MIRPPMAAVFGRMVVGPASTSAERANNLDVERSLEFQDAYFVTN